jgi:hypothetical protein
LYTKHNTGSSYNQLPASFLIVSLSRSTRAPVKDSARCRPL